MFSWFKKVEKPEEGLHFRIHRNTPYDPSVNHGEYYGYIGHDHICTLERTEHKGNTLKVNHFALHDPFIGKGMGEYCLRAFAARVANSIPGIDTINFALYQSTEETKSDLASLKKLAAAREALLVKIGAVNILKIQVNSECLEVTGSWPKALWK
ncbi:hypothetical protein JQR88_25030 (plasmid) [Pseudomonas luteola]|uniref:hypothetical protein n=1 Tax=Pseudomonas luteola TaxID=47886 RepID=UPI003DA0FEC8